MIRRDALLASGVAGFALVLYLRTLAPGLLEGDSGEFQFAAPLLTLAHPTGYPFYLVLGAVWSALVPWGDPAWRMNLLSAVLTAAAIGLFYLVALRETDERPVAVIAATVLAVMQTVWAQAVVAEVYALNTLLVVALMALAQQVDAARRADHSFYLTGLVCGVALAHHRTILLLLPMFILRIWPTLYSIFRRQPPLRRWGHGLLFSLCVVAPLIFYLIIPLRAEATPYARLAVPGGPPLVLYDNSPRAFLDMAMGTVFRGQIHANVDDAVGRLIMAAGLLHNQVSVAGIIVAGVGLVAALAANKRRGLALIIGYGAVVGFCLIYTIGDIADLFTPSYVIIALWIAWGLHWISTWLGQRVEGAPITLYVFAAVLPLSLAVAHLPAVDRSRDLQARLFWEAILAQPVEAGAILVSNDRDEITPLWYLQYVEGRRRDLIGLFPQITPAPEVKTLGTLLDWLLDRGVQPYLIKEMPGLEVKYTVNTGGPLPQVRGLASPPDGEYKGTVGQALTITGVTLSQYIVALGQPITATIAWSVSRPIGADITTFVHLRDVDGQRLAGHDHQPGGVFYPSSQWRPGDTIVDTHVITVPGTLAPGIYALYAGVYVSGRSIPLDGDAAPIQIGTVRLLGPEGQHSFPDTQRLVSIRWQDGISLLGWSASADRLMPGDTLTITLLWTADWPPQHNWTVFAHLADANGRPLAQVDRQPFQGRLPTSAWLSGERILESYVLRLPNTAAAGFYRIRVGLYDAQSGQRLRREDGEDAFDLNVVVQVR